MAPVDALQEQLSRYCASRWTHGRFVRVQQLERIFGGASRETWRFQAIAEVAGTEQVHALILRRDPDASLINTERRREFAACRAFEGSAVPVPTTWWLEEDSHPLGSPFFVMAAIEGCEAAPQKLIGPAYVQHHPKMAQQTWRILGEIAKADPVLIADPSDTVSVSSTAMHELDHWVAILRERAPVPQPISEAAIRWLQLHRPPPAQRLCIVHGDYRIGNVLVSPQGDIRGVLDWEMAHVGDPLEDLAWSINRSWCFSRDGRVGGIATRAQAIEAWAQASGCIADSQALHWWELFSCIKGQAIWLGAARAFSDASNRDVMMAFAAWMMINSQDRAMLELMGHLT